MKSHGKQSYQINPQNGYNPTQKRVHVEVFTSGQDIFMEVSQGSSDYDSTPWATVLVKNGYQEMLITDIKSLEARRDEVKQIVYYGEALAEAMQKYRIPGEIVEQHKRLAEVKAEVAEELKKLDAAKTTTGIARK